MMGDAAPAKETPIAAAPQFPRVVWEWTSELTSWPKQCRLVQTAASAWTLEALSTSKDALGNDQHVWKLIAGYENRECIPIEPLLSLRAKVDELEARVGAAELFRDTEIEARGRRIAQLEKECDEAHRLAIWAQRELLHRQPASSGAAGEREPSAVGKSDGAGLSPHNDTLFRVREHAASIAHALETLPQFDRAKLEPLVQHLRAHVATPTVVPLGIGRSERTELLHLLEAHGL